MTQPSPSDKPQMDPHHDLADAPADPDARGGDAPIGVQDRRGSRPIDRITEPESSTRAARREPAKVGLAIAVAVVLILIGVGIGAFVMERPVPTLGLAAIACGMLLLFAAPLFAATVSEPEPGAKPKGRGATDVAAPRSGPPTPAGGEAVTPRQP